jgi:tight adherence protein B
MNAWIPAILAFVAVAFGIIALALLIESLRTLIRRRDLRSRLDSALTELQQHTMVERRLVDEAVLRARDADELVARLPVLAGAASLLRRARLDWSPLTFVLLIFGFAMAGGMFAMAARMPLPLAVVFALLFGFAPYWYVGRRRKVRLKKFEEQLPEAIDYLARAVRAGHPLSAGIQMVGDELGDPLAAEFRTMFDQQRFGVPFEEALLGMCDRVELVDVRIFATSIIVQREAGGASFGEVLDNMAETIRARFAIRREISVYTAQGRMSGMVVGAMPILVGLGIYAQDPEYIRVLFEHPVGRVMSVIAVVLQILGFLWIRRIVDVEI